MGSDFYRYERVLSFLIFGFGPAMSDLTLLEVFILILLLKVLLLFIFDDPRRDRGVVFIDWKLGFVEGFIIAQLYSDFVEKSLNIL